MRTSIPLAAALPAILLVSCGNQHPPARPAAEAPPVRVATVGVAAVSWPDVLEAVGTVRARTEATISSRMTGYVQEVKVQVGDPVSSGQALVTIDAQELDTAVRRAEAGLEETRSAQPEVASAIASAKAQLELAQTTFRRIKDLFDKKSVSNQEYDEAAARVRVAESGLQQAAARRRQLEQRIQQAEQAVRAARLQRGYADVRAPFGGRVTRRMVEPGNLAAPGAPLLMVEQGRSYRMEAAVEESRLGAVRRGQALKVVLDAIGKTVTGQVSEIAPAVEAASRSFTVKIDLPDLAELRSGLFGRATIPLGERKALAVPAEAVRTQGQLQTVLVADQGYARSRLVTLGARHDGRVEVLSGLREGDKLIHPAPANLADGARVEVQP